MECRRSTCITSMALWGRSVSRTGDWKTMVSVLRQRITGARVYLDSLMTESECWCRVCHNTSPARLCPYNTCLTQYLRKMTVRLVVDDSNRIWLLDTDDITLYLDEQSMMKEAKAGGKWEPELLNQIQANILSVKQDQLSIKNLADPARDE